MKNVFGYLIFFVATVMLNAGIALAQEGELRGKITDKSSGQPVSDAIVFLEGQKRQLATAAGGEFTFLGLWPGTYSVRITCAGYRDFIIPDIRIHAFSGVLLEVQLASSGGEASTLSMQRLAQTGAVHLISKEYIRNTPVRGLENLLEQESGVIRQNGELHVRGGGTGELSFFVNGATATNLLTENGAMTIEAIPETVEEIQFNSGAFGAEFGNATSAFTHTTLRSGEAKFKATFDYRTDDFAKPGEQFLGTSSFGYRHAVATLGGPLGERLRYFIAGQHQYMRNRTVSFVEPFRFDNLTDDGLGGRPAGEPLPDAIIFEQNYLPYNWLQNNTVQGNLVFDAAPLSLRLTGAYVHDQRPHGTDTFTQALTNYFNLERSRENTTNTGFVSLRATHALSSAAFLAFNASYSNRSFSSADPAFGNDWMSYADSAKVTPLGYPGWVERYRGPLAHSIILNFPMTARGAAHNGFGKNRQSHLGFSADLTAIPVPFWKIKTGARFDRWALRHYGVANISNALTFLYGSNGNTPREFDSPEQRALELARAGAISHRGYDVDGNEADAGTDKPQQPEYLAFYAQSEYRLHKVLLNAGLRYERIASKATVLLLGLDPLFDPYVLLEAKPTDHFLPRFGFTLSLREGTSLHGSVGKYLESSIFQAEPARQMKYEFGLWQAIADAMEFNGVFFSRVDKLRVMDPTGYDEEFTDETRGIELNAVLRPFQRLQAEVQYSWTDFMDDESPVTRVVASDGTILYYLTANWLSRVPLPSHRGILQLDYRFAKNEATTFLRGLGLHMIFSLTSGNDYIRSDVPLSLGQSNPINFGVRPLMDSRFTAPTKTAQTPSRFQIDLSLNKIVDLGSFDLDVYVHALNLLNAKHVLNVYPYTGKPDDDGWLSSPLADPYKQLENYEAFYRAINLENRWAYTRATGNDIYGQPRQLRLGARVSF